MELKKYRIANFYQRHKKRSRKAYEYHCDDKLFASGYIKLLFYKRALIWYVTQKLSIDVH